MRIPPLAGPAEVAHMLGVSRQRITQLAAHPGFPRPVAELSMGKVWLRGDIEAWAAKRGRTVHPL